MTRTLNQWTDGPARRAIIDFVSRVCTPGRVDYRPPSDRVAVFDNDGTLWCEKPLQIQAYFLLQKLAEQALARPELCKLQPYKAIAEDDHAWLSAVMTKHYQGDDADLRTMAAALLGAYAGESTETFATKAQQFLRTGRNSLLDRPYLSTVFVPMLELLDYLRDHEFTIYVASAGGRDFMRTVSEDLYGVPPAQVIGSSAALNYRDTGGGVQLVHTAVLDVFDDGPAKVIQIWDHIGRPPLFAAGNANGDIPMLRWAVLEGGMALVVAHDDPAREPAYSDGAERVLDAAHAPGWTVASVAADWRCVFAD